MGLVIIPMNLIHNINSVSKCQYNRNGTPFVYKCT